jgi:ribulose-phosphate 3-epimerase
MSEAVLRGRRVAPSILAADFSVLADQVRTVLDAGARVIHVDVMDGHFVPPLSMGREVVEGLRELVHGAGGMIETHLMVERPENHVEAFAEAGSDVIIVHQEATPHLHYALQAIERAGARPGAAINPSTPPEVLTDVIEYLDVALCMTVNPGWGGQPFIEHSIDKLRRMRAMLPDRVALEVDGGIGPDNAGPCAEAGATRFVAGSSVFRASQDPAEAYRAVAQAAGAE